LFAILGGCAVVTLSLESAEAEKAGVQSYLFGAQIPPVPLGYPALVYFMTFWWTSSVKSFLAAAVDGLTGPRLSSGS